MSSSVRPQPMHTSSWSRVQRRTQGLATGVAGEATGDDGNGRGMRPIVPPQRDTARVHFPCTAMKIAKYWEKTEGTALTRDGQMYRTTCWGGSSESTEQALQLARAKLRHWARLVQEQPDPFDTYGYEHGEIREELVEEVTGANGALIGAITRNGYGVLVLNTPRLLIADVDTQPAGLRADPLYQRLCQSQHCYRARLSPKPWRCGTTRPPNRYPREPGEAAQAYTRWLAAYSHHAAGYAVCRPLLTLGTDQQDEDTTRLMALHQTMTVRPGELPLA